MPIYNVSVIHQNLRREETVIQIAESLNYLSDVTNDIFARINNRLELNNKNLNGIQERIAKVNQKILSLSLAKNAIQVFSSSKYPATETNKPYTPIFDAESYPVKAKFPIQYKEQQIKDEPLEKLQFFHFTSNNNEVTKSEGLGDMPVDINSVNDYLLYNSGKNLYLEYVASDSLLMSQVSKKQQNLEGQEIGAAPLSISERLASTKIPGENYFYSPDLGVVPALDVPVDLPDLPGIADNLRYIYETEPGIAPSVITMPGIPSLPPVDTAEVTTEIETTPEPIVTKVVNVPQIIEDTPVLTENEDSIKVIEDKDQVDEVIKNEPLEVKKPSFEADNIHASLMDAIRKAGGLKNAKLRSIDPKEVESNKPSGDLMADFHAKLSLRRKGISGAKKANEWDAGSAMQRISRTIPPPQKSEQSESATTDEEWN